MTFTVADIQIANWVAVTVHCAAPNICLVVDKSSKVLTLYDPNSISDVMAGDERSLIRVPYSKILKVYADNEAALPDIMKLKELKQQHMMQANALFWPEVVEGV
ncbi:hypothetical protein [Lentilitoribacter sp. EG35]|uniref:hypothetical protein n=1 Tax=Lentilitoribacter sp. EG35 TaxID=3234192 RepID=UPI00345F4DB2